MSSNLKTFFFIPALGLSPAPTSPARQPLAQKGNRFSFHVYFCPTRGRQFCATSSSPAAQGTEAKAIARTDACWLARFSDLFPRLLCFFKPQD